MSAHTATLGRTGIETSRIGLGTWGLANPGAHPAAQCLDEREVAEQVGAALEAGVTLFDTAEVYDNEEMLGRVIREAGADPADLVISSKFGHGKGFSAGQIRASVERTLAAFCIERVPLFMLHDPRNDDDLATIAGRGGALGELRKLQDEGLVGSIGIATGTLGPLKAAVESDEYDVIQFPRLYTLLNTVALTSGLLARAREKGVGTILTSPFTGNILGTGVRGVADPLYSFWPAQPEVVDAVARLQHAADAEGIALPEAAVAFALAQPLIDAVVIGVTSADQLRQDVAVQDREIDRAVLDRLAEAADVDLALVGGPEFVWPFPLDRMPADLKAKLGL